MSTYYAPFDKVHARDLFDGRLEKFCVREQLTDDTTETSKCLTDGRNYLWVYINDAGIVSNIKRSGANAPSKILNAIAEAFDTTSFQSTSLNIGDLTLKRSGMRGNKSWRRKTMRNSTQNC
jgi:hypothetical protein